MHILELACPFLQKACWDFDEGFQEKEQSFWARTN